MNWKTLASVVVIGILAAGCTKSEVQQATQTTCNFLPVARDVGKLAMVLLGTAAIPASIPVNTAFEISSKICDAVTASSKKESSSSVFVHGVRIRNAR